jgi:hypothetical protein
MDTFTVETLQNYIKYYKKDIELKLANEKFTDKNISTQADLINMTLDYSPTVISTIQLHDQINISRLRSKPSIKKKLSSIKSWEINDSKNEERSNSGSLKNNSNKDENKVSPQKNSLGINSMNNSLKDETIKGNNTLRDSYFKLNSFENVRLIQKKQIRIYILSTSNYFEIDFTPEETIFLLKKKILNKLENAVNVNLKHHLIDAYEVRSTKDMNIIYIKSKIRNEESKEKCEPDMDSPPFRDENLIKDINKDALCFIERPGYASYRANHEHSESLIEDNKKVYGEIISDTGESKVNIKIYIRVDNNQSSKVVNLDSDMKLKDVFDKISNYSSIRDKNSEYYYFVEHSEERDNENMDLAINPDLEVKYLSPYILDLYKKKFEDVPSVNRISSYSINLNDDIKENTNKSKEYVFNETTAGVYQEFSVVKINSHNKRQERILGIDLYNLKNEIPKSSTSLFSRKRAKIQIRKIKDIKEVKSTGEKTFELLVHEDNQTIKTIRYEAPNVNKKNEIIAKLNYLIKMNNN